ncbi:MAG: OsmC family protein [Dokdonella sp.]|jgi:osmotically inducible protein OsmC|uniref:OsmC family protein n=1 Tax=Dokdonella sp. TaxID=2291710 RepID=UPI002BFCC94E|nr:OsmC family protein [Dokdonella sp.]HOX71656.1 OsmC family protein [Dokdonella sp.]HPG93143.1 OsmC family protein [Dokdonella sp.]HPN78218.1 OsmC family protein [Dokdonella sp.]
MAIVRKGEAEWKGGVPEGSGSVSVQSGAFKGTYGFKSRMEDGPGTNPEELIGAAHAACYSMAFSLALAQAGHVATSVRTTSKVHLEKRDGGYMIPLIELETEGNVPGISDEQFQKLATATKTGCPVSRALAAVEMTLVAKLL